jgi:hypothetical protein
MEDRWVVVVAVSVAWLLLVVELITGRIYGRGSVWARRDQQPNTYWAWIMIHAAMAAIVSWFLLKAAFDPT